MEFPGIGFRETLTEEKRNACISSLMNYMKDRYNTADKIRSYVLNKINCIIRRKNVLINELSKKCFMGDFCDKDEKPIDCLEAVLKGKKNMQYTVLDRLAVALDFKNERVFPFERKNLNPVAVAEYVLFPCD